MEVFDCELRTRKAIYYRCTAQVSPGSPSFTVHWNNPLWKDDRLEGCVARSDVVQWSEVISLRRYVA